MKRSIFILVVLYSAVGQATIVEWRVADGGNGHFYEAVYHVAGARDWHQAQSAAIYRRGYLATITSAEENAFIFSVLRDDQEVWPGGIGPWIGGFQVVDAIEPDGGWEWVTGEPFIYTNWSINQPDNAAGGFEHWLHFYNSTGDAPSPEWNDLSRGVIATNSYIVEYIPEPATLLLFGLGAVILRKLRP